MILFKGKNLTVNPPQIQLEALATAGDKIIALRSFSEKVAYKDANTRMIDLQGQLAIPTLIIGHGHYTSLGQPLLALDLRYAKSWKVIVEMVAEKVQEGEDRDWILAWGWRKHQI